MSQALPEIDPVRVAAGEHAGRAWKWLQKMQLNSVAARIIENTICFAQIFAISIKPARPAYAFV
jgi:hypothetical protein